MKLKKMVALAVISDGKLLLAQSARAAMVERYSTIDRYFEDEDKVIEEAISLTKDKLEVDVNESDLELLLKADDMAASDPDLMITKYVVLVKDKVTKLPKTDDEILEYKWFSLGDDESVLSNTIKNHLLNYLKVNNLLK